VDAGDLVTGVRFVLPGSWSGLARADLSGLTCTAETVGQALEWLSGRHPVLRQRVLADDGTIAPWTLVSLAGERVTDASTPIPADGSELHVIAMLMGG
jgi:hypothetical protein